MRVLSLGLIAVLALIFSAGAPGGRLGAQQPAPQASPAPATGETTPQKVKRVALLIGNSAYQHAPTLKNPVNDAQDLAKSLERLGFKVIIGVDLTREAMERTIREYLRVLDGADLGLFFYAGHGLQVGATNYIVPIDAELKSESELDFEAVPLDRVLKPMERVAPANIVLLDACRDNPLAKNLAQSMGTRSVSVGRGLARIESGVGTLIAYSTQPGSVAQDGIGRNSPFTGALLRYVETPGLGLTDLMIEVRRDVLSESHGAQVPWDSSSLTDKIYLAAPPTDSSVAQPVDRRRDAFVLGAAHTNATSTEQITDCDRLAASPMDDNRVDDSTYVFNGQVRPEAVAACRAALRAAPNVARFQFQLARALEETGTMAEAMPLYRQAADAGSDAAMFNLAINYINGDGVPKDVKVGIDWMRKAADKGHPLAMFNLGLIYMKGAGVAKDPKLAATWFRKAIALGEHHSMRELALCLDIGTCGKHVPKEVADLILEAYRRQLLRAQDDLLKSWTAWQMDTRQAIQTRLKAIGLYNGPINGTLSDMTKDALKKLADRTESLL